jgi:hypothetical protein
VLFPRAKARTLGKYTEHSCRAVFRRRRVGALFPLFSFFLFPFSFLIQPDVAIEFRDSR